MAEPQFGIERATAGLVTTLFLASALLLAGILYFILRDMDRRTKPEDEGQNVGVERVVPQQPSASPPFRPVRPRV